MHRGSQGEPEFEPAYCMNCRRETVKLGEPACGTERRAAGANHGLATGQPQELGSLTVSRRVSDARLPARRAYSSERRTPTDAVAAGDS
jgi:hypothetical protein